MFHISRNVICVFRKNPFQSMSVFFSHFLIFRSHKHIWSRKFSVFFSRAGNFPTIYNWRLEGKLFTLNFLKDFLKMTSHPIFQIRFIVFVLREAHFASYILTKKKYKNNWIFSTLMKSSIIAAGTLLLKYAARLHLQLRSYLQTWEFFLFQILEATNIIIIWP